MYNVGPAHHQLPDRHNGVRAVQGAIGADMNSFREDDTARGPLIRRT